MPEVAIVQIVWAGYGGVGGLGGVNADGSDFIASTIRSRHVMVHLNSTRARPI